MVGWEVGSSGGVREGEIVIRMFTLERFFHKNDKGVEALTVLVMNEN